MAVPGNRVTVIGIYSIKKAAKQGRGRDKGAVGVRMPYLRVVGIQVPVATTTPRASSIDCFKYGCRFGSAFRGESWDFYPLSKCGQLFNLCHAGGHKPLYRCGLI